MHTEPRSSVDAHPPHHHWHHEWQRLRARRALVRRADAWGVADGPVHDLDDVLAAVGYDVPATPATEQALLRLVAIARHDELAARVVVQRILPGLLAVMRRRSRFGFDRAALDELVGAAWIVVRTYNPDRRPSCLAAALISDSAHRAFRRPRRQWSEVPLEAAELPTADRDRHPAEELVDLVSTAVRIGLADLRDADLVASLIAERHANDAAARLGVTPKTFRSRRARLTRRLRAVALAA